MRTFPLLLALLALPLYAADPEPAKGAAADEPAWDVNAPHGPTHEVSLDLHEGTWMSVTVSGDRVVFDLLGDLWSMPISGGEASRLSQGAAWDTEPRFSPDGTKIAYTSDRGGSEQIWVMNADGTGARQLTDDKGARFTDPVWDPSGPYILGRRRTVDTRSIGVTELWLLHLEGGKGVQLTSLDQHPHAGEAAFSADGRYVYFSSRNGRFEYDGNPVAGLWTIQRLDRDTGEVQVVVNGSGSAARPTLTPDGKSLVFLSRDRTRSQIEIIDLSTGARRVLADWIETDQLEGFALHGVFPSMAWGADGRLVLWANGGLWRLGLDGKKESLPFHVKGSWTLTDVPRWQRPIGDAVQAKLIRWPTWSSDGRIAFSAMGVLWVRKPDGSVERISPGTGYAPAWSPDGAALAWTSWDDTTGGALHITRKGKTEDLPIDGQLVNPAWSADGTKLYVLRATNSSLDVDLGSVPFFEIVELTRAKKTWESRVVTTTPNRGSGQRAPRLFPHEGRIYWLEDRAAGSREPDDSALVSVQLDGKDKRDHLLFDGAQEAVPSPDFTRVAYQQEHKVYVTALPRWSATVKVADEVLPTFQLSDIAGGWLGWTADSGAVTWAEGPNLRKKTLHGVGVEQGKDTPKGDDPDLTTVILDLHVPRAVPTGTIAYTHARVITMHGEDVVEDATVVVEGDRIKTVQKSGAVPAGAEVVDLSGKTIMPGLIDVHAHLHYSAGDVLPAQEWRYQTALDFGVTTVHDPSASTDLVFTQAERVDAGYMAGPRVYSTGFVLYGALGTQIALTPDLESARGHVQRLKTVGATSVKVYQQPERRQRQWYTSVCRELQMECVAEGGGDLWQDLSMVADGIQSVEHALSISPLYADVLGFFAGSHTADTYGSATSPTLLVAYGGMSGEHWFYQHMNPLDDQRLLRHYPRRMLDTRTWRLPLMAQDGDWNFQRVARDTANLQRLGALTTLGAHGQLQGLGAHWELWGLAGEGAMSPMEAIRTGTIDGARYLGLDSQLGSIEGGKLADFIVLDKNPLDDIHNSTAISFTVKNGVRYP